MPIQFAPDWMDAVCVKGSWDVVSAYDDESNLQGVLLFHIRKYRGFKFILMPICTFYNGIYFNHAHITSSHDRIKFEHAVSEKLIAALPKHDLYFQQFSPRYNDWLPYYWKGYKQSTRYTYIVDRTIGESGMWSLLKKNVQRNIRRSEKTTVIEDVTFEEFWESMNHSFSSRSDKSVPYNKAVLGRLVKTAQEKGFGEMKVCRSKETNEVLCGTFVTYDKSYTYYVCSFYNSNVKNRGASCYLLWYHLLNAPTPFFDFEGSILKEVEYFNRNFGGTLTPHYKIWKVHNPLLRFILKFKKAPFLDY